MFIVFDDNRPSDSPFIERVWRCHSEGAGMFVSVATSHWDLVVEAPRHAHAASLLRGGATIGDVVDEAGYFDQAHLTRSLGRLIGLTPARIARKERQLSFLYKTPPPARD
jgi:hypothetical protein